MASRAAESAAFDPAIPWPSNLIEGEEEEERSHPPESRCWELFQTRRNGRGIRATRDIGCGEQIFRERTLIAAAVATSKNPRTRGFAICYVLLELNDEALCRCGLLICPGSSSDCIAAHRWECALLSEWLPIGPLLQGCADARRKLMRILPAVRSLRLVDNERTLFEAMQANESTVIGADGQTRSTKRRCAITDALSLFDRPPASSIRTRLLRAAAVMDTNAFEAVLPARSATEHDREVRLCGMFALGGQLNHECTPNTRHSFGWLDAAGGAIEMAVHATSAILAGAELTTTYTRLLWDRRTRRTHLWLTKQFWCECDRCSGGSAVDDTLTALRCRQCATGRLLPVAGAAADVADDSQWQCSDCGAQKRLAQVDQTRQIVAGIVAGWETDVIGEQLDGHPIVRRLVWADNAMLVEARLRVIWSDAQSPLKAKFCNEILTMLQLLGAGECTLKKLIQHELQQSTESESNNKVQKCPTIESMLMSSHENPTGTQ